MVSNRAAEEMTTFYIFLFSDCHNFSVAFGANSFQVVFAYNLYQITHLITVFFPPWNLALFV